MNPDNARPLRITAAAGTYVEFVPEKLNFFVEQSLMIATSLTPYIGYDKSAKVVKEAYKRGCSIKEIILEEKLMTEDEFAEAVRMK